jgi:hypothetical protein
LSDETDGLAGATAAGAALSRGWVDVEFAFATATIVSSIPAADGANLRQTHTETPSR